MDVRIQPDSNGIAAVEHGLGTVHVRVRCFDADGQPVKYRFHAPISGNEIEVVTIPGSGVVAVSVEACELEP